MSRVVKKGVFPCEVCSKVFEVKRNLTKHCQRVHSKPKDSNDENGPFRCKICRKAFIRLSHLQRHNLAHLGVREWACPLCEDAFIQKAHLVKHLQRKHPDDTDADIQKSIDLNRWREAGEQPSTSQSNAEESPLPVSDQLPSRKSHPCTECGRIFFDGYLLKRHVESTHKEFLCSCCHEVFKGATSLKLHQMKTRDDIHQCHKCKATFSRATELNTHRNSCLGLHSFLCVPCGETFAQRVQLDRHWNKSHFEDVSSCKQCGEKQMSPIEMKKHYQTVHSLSLCGYCGVEDDSKSHISNNHWIRLKNPLRVENPSPTQKRHLEKAKDFEIPNFTASSNIEFPSSKSPSHSGNDAPPTSSAESSSDEEESADEISHDDAEEIDDTPTTSSHFQMQRRPPPIQESIYIPSAGNNGAPTSGRNVMNILVPVPPRATHAEIMGRIPEEMLIRHPELRDLDSIDLEPSIHDRDILLFIDVRGSVSSENGGSLIKLLRMEPMYP